MAFVKFMRNKFFHPHTYENQKRTWIAEQKHEAEKKAQEELHKQYLKEQAIYENKNLLKHGKLTQEEKLSFMYEPPLQCRKKDEKLELREVRFEWQKNAPREGNYAKNLDVADRPFGIEVRNTKCIKCGVWGHMNTDKICPLYNRGMNTEENPPDLGKEDPMSLLNSMEKGGLKMRKHAVNSVMDVHDNKYKMLEDEKLDPEIAFIANLTDKQKRKLMKKLNKNGGTSGGVTKAKHKKKKNKKEKKKKKRKVEEVEEEEDEETPAPPGPDTSSGSRHRNRDLDKRTDSKSYRKSPRRNMRSAPPRRRSRSRSPKHQRRASSRSQDHYRPSRISRSPKRRERRELSRSPARSRRRSGRNSPSPARKGEHRQTHREKQRIVSKRNVRHDSTDSSDQGTSNPRRVSSSSSKNNISNSRKQRHDTKSSESDSEHKTSSKFSKNPPRGKGKEKKRPVPQSSSDSEQERLPVRHDTPSDSSSDSDSDRHPGRGNSSRSGKEKAKRKAKQHSSSSSSD